jgi:hypothetical protein
MIDKLAAALRDMGHEVSASRIPKLLECLRYRRQVNRQAPKQGILDMTALPVARGPDGRILPGHSGNPSGRPVGSISDFRRRFEPHMGEVAETLLALMRSPNESTRLSACREICDRVLGRAAIAIDATHTKLDVGQLYLAALKRANGVIDGGKINGSGDTASE